MKHALSRIVFLVYLLNVSAQYLDSELEAEQENPFRDAAKLKYEALVNDAYPQCDEFWMLGHAFDTMLDYALSAEEVLCRTTVSPQLCLIPDPLSKRMP
jgi:hypothetical protein